MSPCANFFAAKPNRREFLRAGALPLVGLGLPQLLQVRAAEQQAVGTVEQGNGIRSVAWGGKNFQRSSAEIDFVVIVKKA